MKKGRRLTGMLLAASMAVMLLAGCGGTAAAPEESGAVRTSDKTEEASCIKIGVSGTPDLDPAIVNTGSSLIAAVNLYDTLVFPSAEEESGVAPRAAEDWTVSDDGLQYTFHLKQGIRFHNGEEMRLPTSPIPWIVF